MTWRAAIASAFAFAVGCSPLIAYNLTHWMQTFKGHGLTLARWGEPLLYRYHLFLFTFDGRAVYDVINQMSLSDIGPLMLKDHAGGMSTFLAALSGLPISATFMPQLLALSGIVLLILGYFKRLSRARAVLFFFIQFAVTAIFISLADDATGPHHTIMVYPMPQILIAGGFDALFLLGVNQRKLPLRLLRPCSWLVIAALLATQIIVDARYVRSFEIFGGKGKWSDAIYDLAGYAQSRPDRTFLLMDWGCGAQLLLLTGGTIKAEATTVAAEGGSDEEKLARLKPYLTQPGSLLVFHAPAFETYPLLSFFQQTVNTLGLAADLVKTFRQRDGQPIFYLYEVPPKGTKAYLREGKYFYFREAEQWSSRNGGDLDRKQGASGGRALGNYWGRNATDAVTYRFSLPREVSDAHLFLRYAFEGVSNQQYLLYVDGSYAATMTLPATGGYGYSEKEWRLHGFGFGALAPGTHEFKITPAASGQIVNLDYFYICEGYLNLALLQADR